MPLFLLCHITNIIYFYFKLSYNLYGDIMKKIETIEQWNILAEALHKQGYSPFQAQYYWDHPEGFHAWFIKDKTVEVVTHNEDVERGIVGYGSM
jgi:hypothetical protein